MDDRLKLLLHPVRLRLVHALRSAGALTTAELCERLPDVAKATIYRQVDRLVRGGVFVVDHERRIRGAVERTYRLDRSAIALTPEDAATMSAEDHRRGFAASMTALLGDFGAYLDQPGVDPLADNVSYRQFVVWLSPEERSCLVAELTRVVLGLPRGGPFDGRQPHLLSTILFPTPGA